MCAQPVRASTTDIRDCLALGAEYRDFSYQRAASLMTLNCFRLQHTTQYDTQIALSQATHSWDVIFRCCQSAVPFEFYSSFVLILPFLHLQAVLYQQQLVVQFSSLPLPAI